MKGEKYTVHIRQQQEAKTTDKESADKGNGMYVTTDWRCRKQPETITNQSMPTSQDVGVKEISYCIVLRGYRAYDLPACQ
jgi:hypothetical protein